MHHIQASALSCYLDVAASLDLDGERFLAEEGIPLAAPTDDEKRLPASAVSRLLNRSAEQSGVDSFAMRMAQRRTFASLGSISLLLERLNTVADVIAALSELRDGSSDIISVSTRQSDGCVIVTFNAAPAHGDPQTTDLVLGLGYLAVAGASHGLWVPECVHFAHAAPQDRVTFERFYKAPLSFNDSFNGFSLSGPSLEIALPLADPRMAHNARRLLRETLRAEIHGSVRDHASRAISALLPADGATLKNVASSLDRSTRVLQRQLRQEGSSFKKLLNDLKKDMALKYLQSSSEKIINIGESLGYSSHASFTRWFRNEFGVPPSKTRRAHQLLDDATVIFSQRNGEVWATRADGVPLANLGPHDVVTAMMLDYIEQTEAAKRLANAS